VSLIEVTAGSSLTAAPALLGWTFLCDGVGGRIVEVEAYLQDDPASHSYGGERPRTRSMFGPPGHLYVYRSYGVHWCMNITCGPPGVGAAVLIRALEPTHGLERMRSRRAGRPDRLLCSGPGRLTQALAIDASHDAADLSRPPFRLLPPVERVAYDVSPRIGISKATGEPWRFVERASPWVSRPPRRA
jgi:DNA-3-methyladenine glycosylase